jgi:hypothetical protein
MTALTYNTDGATARVTALETEEFRAAADPIIAFVLWLAEHADASTVTKVKALIAEGAHLAEIKEALLAHRDLPLFTMSGTLPHVSADSAVTIDELTKQLEAARTENGRVRKELETRTAERDTARTERDAAVADLADRTTERDDALRDLATRTAERDTLIATS